MSHVRRAPPARRRLRAPGFPRRSCCRPRQLGFRFGWIEIIGRDRAAGELAYAGHVDRAWAPPSRFPVVPQLPHRSDAARGFSEGQVLLFAPPSKRVLDASVSHSGISKLIANSLTSASSEIGIFPVSADILHFAPMWEAPNRIRELRMKAKLSQQALGDRIGTSKVTISDLERGKMALTLDYMRRIAKVLGLGPADLIPRDDHRWALSVEEQELVERFREASTEQRHAIQRVAEALVPFAADRKVA